MRVSCVRHVATSCLPLPLRSVPGRFIISYHLLDRTLSVWEPPQANSGMTGGTFLERTKVKKEGGAGAGGSLADIGGGDHLYTDADMEVGGGSVLLLCAVLLEPGCHRCSLPGAIYSIHVFLFTSRS